MKVTVLGGAGGVGTSLAFNLLLGPDPYEIVLVDPRGDMIVSHLMDLEQVLELGGSGSVRVGAEPDLLDADVVVVTASVPLRPNTSRLVFLEANAAIVSHVAGLLAEAPDWGGVLVLVTNPVDPLCLFAQRCAGVDRRRILGYTLNDTLRLRTGIGHALGVAPGGVEAWAIGEHGDLCVPLLDRVRVGGVPVSLTAGQRAEAEEFLRTWYVRHVGLDSGRTSTWTSGLGVARMVAAVARDSGELWPASVVLEGEYGIEGASLSVPVTLGRAGATLIHEWELAPHERRALLHAADLVREAALRIDEPARGPARQVRS